FAEFTACRAPAFDLRAGKKPTASELSGNENKVSGRLAHNQNFTNIVASQEKFNGGKIAEKVFNIAVVKYALQAERPCPVSRVVPPLHRLHFQNIVAHNVIAVIDCVR